MKTKIVTGCILVIIVLITLPSISAIESNTVDDTIKSKIDMTTNKTQNNEKFKDFYVDNWLPGSIIYRLLWSVLFFIFGFMRL